MFRIFASYIRQVISVASHDPYFEKLNLLMAFMLADRKKDLSDARCSFL